MRKISIVIAVLLVMALIVSCSPSPAPPAPKPSPAPVPAPTSTAAPVPTVAPKPPPGSGGVKLTPNPVEAGTPKYRGILRTDLGGDPIGFDMHLKPSFISQVGSAMYNKLVRLNPEYFDVSLENVVGDLAKSFEKSPDGKTYTFFLEKNVKWHDGKPFGADDVVYSIEKFMDPKRSNIYSDFPAYDRVEKIDDSTVKIYLKYPSATFLLSLAAFWAVMQPKHNAAANPQTTDYLVGTGPFMFKEYKQKSSFAVVKNPSYFRKDKSGGALPYLDGITSYLLTGTASDDALVAGRIDIALFDQKDLQRLERLKKDIPSMKWTIFHEKAPWFLFLNSKSELLKDPRVRRAIGLVIKPEDFILARFGALEMGEPGRGILPETWGLTKDEIAKQMGWNQPYEARVAEAKKLMKDAGYEKGFTLRLRSQQQRIPDPMVGTNIVLADALKVLNIVGEVQGLAPAEAAKMRSTGDFDILSDQLFDTYGDPEEFLTFFTTGGSNNYAGYSNPELDKLAAQQSRELDATKRREIVNQIERILLRDLPALPTGLFPASYAGLFPYIKNVRRFDMATSAAQNLQREDVWLDK